MNEIIKEQSSQILKIKNSDDEIKPFQKEVLLIETELTGISFLENSYEVDQNVKVGDRLQIIFEDSGKQVGYEDITYVAYARKDEELTVGRIPRKEATVLSRLHEVGREFFAVIKEKHLAGNWMKIKVEIYMKD